jgi:hypothetical protein
VAVAGGVQPVSTPSHGDVRWHADRMGKAVIFRG